LVDLVEKVRQQLEYFKLFFIIILQQEYYSELV